MIQVLPGHKFSVWIGWIIGVILTSNPRTLPKFRALKTPYTIYLILLTLLMALFAADFTLNIFPSNVLRITIENQNHVTVTLIRAIMLFHTCTLVIFRLYFLLLSAKVSTLLRSIGNYCDMPHKKAGREIWSTIILMVLFTSITLDTVSFAIAFSIMDKGESWFSWLNDTCYTTLASCFVMWPAYMVRLVAFALANTTLENLLRMFENFCFRMELALNRGVDQEQKAPKKGPSHRKVGQPIFLMEQNVYCQHLMNRYEEIQQLFKLYDKVFGPIILMLVASCTIGFIDIVTQLLKPRTVVQTNGTGSTVWAASMIIGHLMVLSILNTGHKARNRIEEGKESLKKKFGVFLSSNGNETIRHCSNVVGDWDWKMSAAGFFVVDRSLMSGMVSTMMTYVVLLLQLQERNKVTSNGS